jgi:hypothetical protein
MSEEINNLPVIAPPVTKKEARLESNVGYIQKNKTGWAFLGWIFVIVGGYFLYQGYAYYADGTNPEIIKARQASERLSETVARARETIGLSILEPYVPTDMMAEASKHVWIGAAFSIVGLGLAFGTSVFRCSQCSGKVGMVTAKICPSCGTRLVERK